MKLDHPTTHDFSGIEIVNFDDKPEMRPYLKPPSSMYVGAPGKHGYLRLGFELDKDGKSILRDLDRRVPLIVQKELYFDQTLPGLPCVYILSSGGANLDGDRYRQDFTVREGAMAWISTGAATKISVMYDNYAGMSQTIRVEKDAYLEYMPEPIIPSKHARYISDTLMVVDKTATAFYSEIYMPGRKYHNDEVFQFDVLSVCTHGERPDGEKLFREKFVIDPNRSRIPDLGVMGGYEVFANVLVLTPEEKAREIYDNTAVFIDRERGLATGITHLPNGAGLLYKVIGRATEPVKMQVREFCSTVRQAVKGVPIPHRFPWGN